MIILMKEGVEGEVLKKMVLKLFQTGAVQVEDLNPNENRGVILAVLSVKADKLDPAVIKKMPGVKGCTRSNKYFDRHWPKFYDICYLFNFAC